MPVDWNDRTQVEQALIKARNAGVSDEDFIAYAKERRASVAGSTLQARQADLTAPTISNQSPILTSRLAEMGSYQTPEGVHVPQAQESLPYVFGAPGQAAREAINYIDPQFPGQKPSIAGAATRVGIQAAVPIAVKKAAQFLSPLAQKAQPILSKLAGPAGDVLDEIGTSIRGAINRGMGELTATRQAKDALLAQLGKSSPEIPIGAVVGRLRAKAPIFAQDEMENIITKLESRARSNQSFFPKGTISYPDFQEFVREAYRGLNSKASAQALSVLNDEFKQTMFNSLNRSAGPVAAQKFLDYTEATRQTLNVFETLNDQVGSKNAVNVARHFMRDGNARAQLKALDSIMESQGVGMDFSGKIEKIMQQESKAAQRIQQIGATKEANAALLKAQNRARSALNGIMYVASTFIGGMEGGGMGAVGGAGFAHFIGRKIVGSMEGAIARGMSGLSDVATPATAAAIQATQGSNEDTQK